ncbi:peptidoglycan recognition protein family protein [Nocardiopsis potens]|uniref:peptidoglycan recognition protein family protein n=1 Tax=Nocardiopsis potens TaxID=1246458 RepID=UPI00068546C9|nr:peptidoglycan recognition family protein [Nocardiopsis potens]
MSSHAREDGPGGIGRRAVLRGGLVAAGGVLLGGAAQIAAAPRAAAAAEPPVHTRAAWAARPPKSPAQVLAQAPAYIVVHHTATANSTDHSLEHAFSLSRAIQNFHMDTNGWDDTGQQLTISRGGHIMEGRNSSLPAVRAGDHVVGAHVANYNGVAVGIENEGTYTSAQPTGALYDALVETCAWLCSAYARPVSAIIGHRDLNATACPGDVLYGMLPQLRRDVGALLGAEHRRPLPASERPPYPRVPEPGRILEFRHGPALGRRDPNAG